MKLNKIASIATVGGMGVLVVFAITGCEQKPAQKTDAATADAMKQASQKDGVFMVIQEVAPGAFKVVEQYPAQGPSRAILKDLNGTERLLNDVELKALAEQEAKKVENNTSRLTQENPQMHSGGMSLGETILASAAGALIGGYIANKLFNNQNFNANQRAMSSPAAISQPAVKSQPATNTAPAPQKGYFQNSAQSPSAAQGPSSGSAQTTQSAKPQSGYFSNSGSSGQSSSSSPSSSSSGG